MKKDDVKLLTVIAIIFVLVFLGYFVAKNNYLKDKSYLNNSSNVQLADKVQDCKNNCPGECAGNQYCITECQRGCERSSGGGGGGNGGSTNPSYTPTPVPTPEPCPFGYEGTKPNCTMIKITGVDVGTYGTYFEKASADGGYFALAQALPNGKVIANYKLTNKSGYSMNGARVLLSGHAVGKGISPACDSTSVVAYNDVSKSTSKTITACVYCGSFDKWVSGYWKMKGHPGVATAKSVPGCTFYDDGHYGKYWTKASTRCCGDSIPESDYGFCYGDEPYIGIATRVEWHQGPKLKSYNGLSYVYEGSDDWDKSECHLLAKPDTCEEKNLPPEPVKKEATKCEDKVDFDFDSSTKICASGNSSFYQIKCHTDIKSIFDMDDNVVNSNYRLFKGQGFKFNIEISEKVTCSGTFNPNAWETAFERVMAKLRTVKPHGNSSLGTAEQAYMKNSVSAWDKYMEDLEKIDGKLFTSDTKSFIIWWYKVGKALEELIDNYNKFEPTKESTEQANFTMKYLINGSEKEQVYTTSFERDSTSCKPVKTIKKTYSISNKPKWIESPKQFVTVYEKHVNLYPESVTIDKTSGDVTNKATNVLEGGNKIYIDNDAKAQTIPLSIVVTELARNKSKITNNACSIKISDLNLLYRPIDITNPFISDSWEKGENWINSVYDFTSTIHSNVWSGNSLYKIKLSADMVNEIQKSNKVNKSDSPYLGLCDKYDNVYPDDATKYLCSIIK